METKKVIGIAQVLQHLKDGMTRDDIAREYGITRGECKVLFQHPKLKGRKTIKAPTFVLVDDTDDIESTTEDLSVLPDTEEILDAVETREEKDSAQEQPVTPEEAFEAPDAETVELPQASPQVDQKDAYGFTSDEEDTPLIPSSQNKVTWD